jgi:hypothetical protein
MRRFRDCFCDAILRHASPLKACPRFDAVNWALGTLLQIPCDAVDDVAC